MFRNVTRKKLQPLAAYIYVKAKRLRRTLRSRTRGLRKLLLRYSLKRISIKNKTKSKVLLTRYTATRRLLFTKLARLLPKWVKGEVIQRAISNICYNIRKRSLKIHRVIRKRKFLEQKRLKFYKKIIIADRFVKRPHAVLKSSQNIQAATLAKRFMYRTSLTFKIRATKKSLAYINAGLTIHDKIE